VTDASTPSVARFDSIDALRGLVIALMVIDHTREYAVGVPSVTDPMALDTTSLLVFWLRWLAHFCAPTFTLLAGVSAGLQAARLDRRALSRHLATRGLVLIALEFTVIHIAWTFSLVWPRFYMQVIWALGLSMLFLAAMLYVPARVRLLVGIAIAAGHHLLEPLAFQDPAWLRWVWAILHDRQVLALPFGYEVRTSYPVLPMLGLILIGDALGRWIRTAAPAQRGRTLAILGSACVVAFVLLRATNLYGDPHPAIYSGDLRENLRAMLNVTKYPLSLSFQLMTIGPGLLLLALWDRGVPRLAAPLLALGRAPMFCYIAHLYWLHAGALVVAMLAGHAWRDFDFRATITGLPVGVGFPVWMTIPITIVLIVPLVPAARWYAAQRATGRHPWMRYL
jgi:uncharacterized membrane protein